MSRIGNQQDYARHRGVHPSRITRLKADLKAAGCFTSGGLVLFEKADEYLNSRLNPAKRHEQRRDRKKRSDILGGAGEPLSESQERARSLRVRTALDAIKLKEKQGRLLEKDEVEQVAFTRARMIRDAIMTVPEKLSDELAVMSDAFEIRLKLRKELEAALREDVEKNQ